MPNPLFRHALKVLSTMAVLAALAAPAAEAATVKRTIVKKHHVTKVTNAKKSVTSRQRVKVVVSGKRRGAALAIVPAKPSFGQLAGLQGSHDALDLKSSVALVIDQDTQEVLFSKNEQAVLPIASLTKLMTGVIINGAKLPMDEMIMVTQDDVDTEKGSRSRL